MESLFLLLGHLWGTLGLKLSRLGEYCGGSKEEGVPPRGDSKSYY